MKSQQGAVLVVVLVWLLVLGLSTETAFRSTQMGQQIAMRVQQSAERGAVAELALVQQRDGGLEQAQAQTRSFESVGEGNSEIQAYISTPMCVRADALDAGRYAVLWRQSVTVQAHQTTLTRHAWVRQVVEEAVSRRVCPLLPGDTVPANP